MSSPGRETGDIFEAGDLLNNTYRIVALLGRGGVSEVYKARSEISGRVVAVKALRAEFARDEDFLSLMTREEDVREIRHDAVVRYFDAQRMADGVVYLVMDYVEGPGMDARLKAGGMSAEELMVAGLRIAEGLAAAHARNIVHRDLSPDNIILRGGSPAEAVIIDFGIAKDTNPGAETIVGDKFAGKYAYAAPEQLAGKADPRTDIYSLGALLLATFRGQKPEIGRNPMEVLERKRAPLDLAGVPEPLGRLLAKMTAPEPEDRFQSAEALVAAFRDPSSVPPVAGPDPMAGQGTGGAHRLRARRPASPGLRGGAFGQVSARKGQSLAGPALRRGLRCASQDRCRGCAQPGPHGRGPGPRTRCACAAGPSGSQGVSGCATRPDHRADPVAQPQPCPDSRSGEAPARETAGPRRAPDRGT